MFDLPLCPHDEVLQALRGYTNTTVNYTDVVDVRTRELRVEPDASLLQWTQAYAADNALWQRVSELCLCVT
jgi:hypothetical protein